jgi:hypothetical protein
MMTVVCLESDRGNNLISYMKTVAVFARYAVPEFLSSCPVQSVVRQGLDLRFSFRTKTRDTCTTATFLYPWSKRLCTSLRVFCTIVVRCLLLAVEFRDKFQGRSYGILVTRGQWDRSFLRELRFSVVGKHSTISSPPMTCEIGLTNQHVNTETAVASRVQALRWTVFFWTRSVTLVSRDTEQNHFMNEEANVAV